MTSLYQKQLLNTESAELLCEGRYLEWNVTISSYYQT